MVSMNKIKTWFRKLTYRFRHDFFTVENVVLIGAIVLCFVWTFQSITAMSRNWELSERLAAERKELKLIELEIEAAELENEYYKSEEYQELSARKYLDKKLEGENMLVMPENSQLAKNKYLVDEATAVNIEYSNLDKWVKFLLPKY